jgi:integrase/recombinase XerC
VEPESERKHVGSADNQQLVLRGIADAALGSLGRLVLVTAELRQEVTLTEAAEFVAQRCAAEALLAEPSLRSFERIWRGFARFTLRVFDIEQVEEVDHSHVRRYLVAPSVTGADPGLATQHNRRTALRFMFRILREIGLASFDPTLDVELPPRRARTIRPLTSAEVKRCEFAAGATLLATREPAAWALAEAGGTMAEIGSVLFADIDLRRGSVIVGQRTVPLTDWGLAQLERRSEAVDHRWVLVASPDSSPDSRRVRATELVRNVMRRAGIGGSDVSVRSVAAWTGTGAFAEGGIEEVARRLGLNSLDAAARLVGHHWADD